MTKWRRKSDGLECDVVEAAWDKVQKGAHPGAMLARILPHLPMAAQQAALGDGWEPCGEGPCDPAPPLSSAAQAREMGLEGLGKKDRARQHMVQGLANAYYPPPAPQTAPVAQEPTPKPVSGWQPIETAPDGFEMILAWDTKMGRAYVVPAAYHRLSLFTHWQPVPEPPVA